MLLECSNLSKSYGSVKALDNVSFTLEKGLSFILGPNGSGKTTFIKIVSNIITPDSGEIMILGKHYLDLKPSEIAFSFEKTVFPPSVRVIDCLHAVGELRGNDNTDEIISLFDLESVKTKKFRELSQGYKRRFLVASAFVGFPDVVFLDEPFSNVDIVAKKKMMETFIELRKEINIVVVSHVFTNLSELDSLVVLYNGKVMKNLGKDKLREIHGFKAVFEDGTVVINDVEKVNRLIFSGKRLTSIEPLSLERWLMELF
ncbi:ABC transporter ATP-binding protein [Pyrococcus yayanosii]|uniref:ABC-type transport protein, ATPase component n=1 Tax=Pyrococcus yayanosii (strain CH1 / JCM 16557) TaxID=529709 RepID=F8AFC0_PYRYC|nr:ABC transporter ATP-binding protein [Pyrococcus yayanosii]AEH24953.1 ABC-type transport protein, ATPase component [Pyrococcus yayanosii CH1]